MATHTHTQKKRVGPDIGMELEEEEEVNKLEAEVNEMAQKILHYRTSLPDQLKSTLASILAAQRPPFVDLEPGSSENANPNPGMRLDQETEKIALLKQKISSNASRMPIVLQRMKDCVSRIDQLDSSDVIIHPAFKRNKPDKI